MKLILYHGGLEYITNPNLFSGNIKSDFGPGFYTTPHESQAREWAMSRLKRDGKSTFAVSEYILDTRNDDTLNQVVFTQPTKEWFKLVLDGREGLSNSYDLIIGPVADAGMKDVFDEFYSRRREIRFLSPSQYSAEMDHLLLESAHKLIGGRNRSYTQCVFITQKALQYLEFKDGRRYDEKGILIHTYKHGDIRHARGRQTDKGGIGR